MSICDVPMWTDMGIIFIGGICTMRLIFMQPSEVHVAHTLDVFIREKCFVYIHVPYLSIIDIPMHGHIFGMSRVFFREPRISNAAWVYVPLIENIICPCLFICHICKNISPDYALWCTCTCTRITLPVCTLHNTGSIHMHVHVCYTCTGTCACVPDVDF